MIQRKKKIHHYTFQKMSKHNSKTRDQSGVQWKKNHILKISKLVTIAASLLIQRAILCWDFKNAYSC